MTNRAVTGVAIMGCDAVEFQRLSPQRISVLKTHPDLLSQALCSIHFLQDLEKTVANTSRNGQRVGVQNVRELIFSGMQKLTLV